MQEPIPEMLRSSLESVTLQVKQLDMGSPKSILALAVDPPSECNIKTAVCNLKEVRFNLTGSIQSSLANVKIM